MSSVSLAQSGPWLPSAQEAGGPRGQGKDEVQAGDRDRARLGIKGFGDQNRTGLFYRDRDSSKNLSAHPRWVTHGQWDIKHTCATATALPRRDQNTHTINMVVVDAYLTGSFDDFIIHVRDSHHHDDVASENPREDPSNDIESNIWAARKKNIRASLMQKITAVIFKTERLTF